MISISIFKRGSAGQAEKTKDKKRQATRWSKSHPVVSGGRECWEFTQGISNQNTPSTYISTYNV